MKQLILIASAVTLAIYGCNAQNKKNEQLAKADNGKSLLWKISGNGLQAPSYLFGTIHLICSDDYFWSPAMEKALKTSDKVAFELDMDDATLQTKVSQGMVMENGQSLKDLLSDADYQKLAAFTQDSLGMPLELLQNFKPFAIISLLSVKTLSCNLPESYEGNIVKKASAAGKEIVGLETAADQLALFDGMNQDTTAAQLVEMIDNWDSLKTQYDELLHAYKEQNLPMIYRLILESPDMKDHLDALLFDRNQRWIPKITKLTAAQPTFIAVGAGHLWGEKGVIALLRDAGYEVTPLR